jgi:hypothetical protein
MNEKEKCHEKINDEKSAGRASFELQPAMKTSCMKQYPRVGSLHVGPP